MCAPEYMQYTCEYNVKGANVVKLCMQAHIGGSDQRDESIVYLPCVCSRVHACTRGEYNEIL